MKAWEQREFRLDLRSGMIAAIVANANCDRKQRPQGFSPLDFMPNTQHLVGKPKRDDIDPGLLARDEAARIRAILKGVKRGHRKPSR